MPIKPVEGELLHVRNLALGNDEQGRYLTCTCSGVDTYVFCFNKKELLRMSDLVLSDEELKRLYKGETLDKGDYRLQGVKALTMAMDGMPFRKFKAEPPEQIQAWCMTMPPNGGPSLYVPEEPGKEEVCRVPLCYRVEIQRQENITSLFIRLGDTEQEQYEDGALCYQVGETLPIPIPKTCVNQEIQVCTGGKAIQVTPAPAFVEKYKEI